MEMKMGNDNCEAVVVVPQSHINPMLQFAKHLVSKGLKVTLATRIISAMHTFQTSPTTSLGFDVELISDGSESLHKTLADLISGIQSEKKNGELKFLVYHSGMPWALDIARQHGIDGAPFFTSACGYTSIYYHFLQGTLKLPSEEDDDDRSTATFSLPSMPPLGFADLPSFLRDLTPFRLTLSSLSANSSISKHSNGSSSALSTSWKRR